MTARSAAAGAADYAGRAWQGWRGFWFEPRETSTLALVRIAYGLLAFCWTLSQVPTLLTFYGTDGILPATPELGLGGWTLLSPLSGDLFVVALLIIMLAAAVCTCIGFFPRAAALVLFVGMLSLQRRDPYVHNAGDALLRIMPLYLALSPCGEALSLDRWRKQRARFWEFPLRPQVALRLMQLQVSIVYFDSVWDKVRGHVWNDGTAVSFAVRIDDIARLPVPGLMKSSELVSNVLTYGSLLTEFSIAVLVWNRKARPWVLLAGVALHLGIEWALTVGFFSYAILNYYLAFLSPAAVSAGVLAFRQRLARRRSADAAVARTSP
jgi:hypothetical protein